MRGFQDNQGLWEDFRTIKHYERISGQSSIMREFQDNQALWLDNNTTLSMDTKINCLARIDFLYFYRFKDILFIVNYIYEQVPG